MNFPPSKCYANALGNCSPKISREHYLSEAILKLLEVNRTVLLSNHNAIPSTVDGFAPIGIGSLTASILCENHNSLLSGLDNEAAHLFKTINEFAKKTEYGEQVTISGEKIERWMLKLAFGILASKGYDLRKNIKMPPNALNILFNISRFSDGCGLYVKGLSRHDEKIRFQLKTHSETIEVQAIETEIGCLLLHLLLVNPPETATYGTHKPSRIGFGESYERCNSLIFDWEGHGSGEGIFLKRA